MMSRNRRAGAAELRIRAIGSRYFFIVAYAWPEKYFIRGDYRSDGSLIALRACNSCQTQKDRLKMPAANVPDP
jgi:hypothetical protein